MSSKPYRRRVSTDALCGPVTWAFGSIATVREGDKYQASNDFTRAVFRFWSATHSSKHTTFVRGEFGN
jgi:hypothetical protein